MPESTKFRIGNYIILRPDTEAGEIGYFISTPEGPAVWRETFAEVQELCGAPHRVIELED